MIGKNSELKFVFYTKNSSEMTHNCSGLIPNIFLIRPVPCNRIKLVLKYKSIFNVPFDIRTPCYNSLRLKLTLSTSSYSETKQDLQNCDKFQSILSLELYRIIHPLTFVHKQPHVKLYKLTRRVLCRLSL